MKLKKIIAMVLCFAMVLSTMSFNVFAEDDTNYVAQIGEQKFETVLDALTAAMESTTATEVKLLQDSTELLTNDFEFIVSSDVVITSDTPVKVSFFNNGTTYDLVFGSVNNNAITIDENVTLKVNDRNIWLGYYGDKNVTVKVYGALSAGYQLWSGSDVEVYGTLESLGEALVLRRGKTLTVDGGKINANYFNILAGNINAKNGAVIECGPVWIANTGNYANEGNAEIVLDNATLASSSNLKSATTHADGVNITIMNGSTVSFTGGEHGASQLDENTNLVVSGNSTQFSINALTNNGTIEVVEGGKVSTSGAVTNNGSIKVENEDDFDGVVSGNQPEFPVLSGSGTEAAPYIINSLDDLKVFRDDVNAGNTYAGKYVALAADIDLTGEVWTPIGTSIYDKEPTDADVKMFAGNFDGRNHIITGLSSNGYVPASSETTSTEYSFGLFGYVYAANISNIKLANVNINGGTRTDSAGRTVCGSGVAALIGYYVPKHEVVSVIENCHVLSGTIKASNNMGGLIGYVDTQLSQPRVDITIKNCSNAADVTTEAREAGGIVGLFNSARGDNYMATMTGTVTFKDCVNTGAITSLGDGAPSAGGILGRDHNQQAGQHAKLIFDGCENNGDITVAGNGETHAAGICAGFYAHGAWIVVKNSNNTGNVTVSEDTSDTYAGGLVSYGGVVEILSSTSTGTVTVGENAGNKYVGGAASILFVDNISDFNDSVTGATYYLNGGTSPERAALVDDAALGGNFHLVETAYKDGFEFGGWYDNENLKGSAYTALSPSVKTYYVKWIGPVAKIRDVEFNSIAAALEAAVDGDTIEIFETDIILADETFVIDKEITIKGAGKGKTVLKSSPDGASSVFTIAADNVTISDLTIIQKNVVDNAFFISVPRGGNAGSYTVEYSDIKLENIAFVGGDYGLCITAEDIVVDSCDFNGQDSRAMLIYATKGDSKIINNKITNLAGKYAIEHDSGTNGETAASSALISSGTLTIEGNESIDSKLFFIFNHWGFAEDLTLNINKNIIDGCTNKPIAFNDTTNDTGNEFAAININYNVFKNTLEGRPVIADERSNADAVKINMSNNYWGSENVPVIGLKDSADNIDATYKHYNEDTHKYYVANYYKDEALTRLVNLNAPIEIWRLNNVARSSEWVLVDTAESLADAVAMAESGCKIKLTKDITNGTGVKVESGKDITLDLNGKTYTIASNPVDLTGTEKLGFQLLEDSNITITNGTITSNADSGVELLMMNYANLTLDGVTLDGTNLDDVANAGGCVMSTNSGNTVIKNSTITAPADGVALGVDDQSGDQNNLSISFEGNTVIDGAFECESDGVLEIIKDASVITETPAGYEWKTIGKVSKLFKIATSATVKAYSSTSTVKAGDRVTVQVIAEGFDFTNGDWELRYDPTMFELDANATTYYADANKGVKAQAVNSADENTLVGEVIAVGGNYKQGNEIPSRTVLATYTFTVLPQSKDTVTGKFDIVNAHINTYDYAISQTNVPAIPVDFDITITRAGKVITGSLEVATPTYNGDIQKGNAFVVSDTVVGKENAVITYSETENGIYTTELPTYKKAGSYNIWVKVNVDGYAEYKDEHEYMVIGAKDITLSLEVAAGAAYNKVNVKPVITGVYDTEFEGTLTVTGVEGTYTKDDFIYMGNHIAVAKETRPMSVNAGDNEITITYTKATVDNYADSTETTTVNADKAFATQAIVDDLNAAADAAVTDIYYNGTEHTVMEKIVVPDGWSVAVTRISDGTTNPGVTEVADKEFVEIRYSHANYNDVVVSRVLKVEPLDLTITVPDFDKGAGEPDNFTTQSVTYTSANFVASAEFATIDDLVATGNLNVVIVRKTFGEDDGNYELTATYTPNDNYSIVIDDGDLTIGMPSDTKIEVVNNNVNGNGNSSADYVAGYRLVLVYTNTATARYTYDDKEMFDLSNAGYEYFDNTKAITEQTVDNYKYVYGIIVKAETGKDDAYYAEKVDFIGTNKYAPEKIVYDADINYDDKFSNNDTSSANSVLNVENELDAFFMYYFLKADYDRTAEGEYKSDKMVKLFDVQEVQKFINTKTTIQ